MEPLIAIVGPTAVGKTDLSFAIADAFGSDIISGDAYQIYRHMDIGTAKPSVHELAQYRHYLIDVANPGDPWSAAMFCQHAAAVIQTITAAGRMPLLVGGTGLYIQALLEGYDFSGSPMGENEKEQACRRIARSTEEELQTYIRSHTDWEPADWHELFANSHRLNRLIAAIEAGDGAAFVRSGKSGSLVYHAYVIGLSLPRPVLYERIEKRIDAMIAAGWIEEVQRILAEGAPPDCQAMKAIGYEELAAYIQGTMTLADAVERIKIRTRRFAKRQLTWFKRMPYVHWYEKETYADEKELAAAVIADVQEYMARV
ncbi:MAG: tRNA (adenosine(37)-N6)-dimethylallyltransferase MiaA [Megasphaera sp.]|jgi:tRNA dimethylallyltransferase|nr:tRNA (adenosine(37)-N6)-dimethylallyltransferase MiaA [Megasphaera sp.]MCH4187248.1 tRNA (adenosine(37)-N6)-dimethylallyltransferase MiaA [Megasphaera sp.]MCH4217214.1 tRNA (adenosine(37)-N6)-dimethylallyltransferase MiaA [Megasphaera sp.]